MSGSHTMERFEVMCCKRTRICTSRAIHATTSIAYGGYHITCGIIIKYEGSMCFSACWNCSTNHYWFSPRKNPRSTSKIEGVIKLD